MWKGMVNSRLFFWDDSSKLKEEKNMERKKILKDAGVLLVASLMVLSTVLVTGNTLENDTPDAIDRISNTNEEYVPCATDAEIWKSIDDGIAWLAKQQCLHSADYAGADYKDWGAWGFYNNDKQEFVGNAAITCLALIKLQDYAYETSTITNPTGSHLLGSWNGPFDITYTYYNNVVAGWKYLFRPDQTTPGSFTAHVHKQYIDFQLHGISHDVPDFGWPLSGNEYGLFVSDPLFKPAQYNYLDYETYSTGIFLLALVASGQPAMYIIPAASPPSASVCDYYWPVPIDVDGIPGWESFKQVAQDAVDWLAFAQSEGLDPQKAADYGGRGGWGYWEYDNAGTIKPAASNVQADNSNTGYAVMGLAAAESTIPCYAAPYTCFGCTVPIFVKTEMHYWINAIQDPADGFSPSQNPHRTNYDDGGSWYRPKSEAAWENYASETDLKPNILKTGNLIFEIIFCSYDDNPTALSDAVEFIERHWRKETSINYWGQNIPYPGWGYHTNPANYESMFCLMKGLQYAGITDITIKDGAGFPYTFNWYNIDPHPLGTPPYDDFASVIVSQQDPNDYWLESSSHFNEGDHLLSTLWALLTLERIPTILGPHLRKWADLRAVDLDIINPPLPSPTPTPEKKKCVWPNDTFYYYIEYDNSKNNNIAPGVTIWDQFPISPILIYPIDAWLEIPGSPRVHKWKPTSNVGNLVTWYVGNIPAGETWTLNVTVRVDPEGLECVEVWNFAWATATGLPTLYANEMVRICCRPCTVFDFTSGLSNSIAVRWLNVCMDAGISNINWSIWLDDGIILKGRETKGAVSFLPKNESVSIQSGRILGIGSVNITLVITADCTIVHAYTKGFVLGQRIYVFPLEKNPPSIEGDWLLSTFDWQGNKTKDQGVNLLLSGYDVTITDDVTQDILFKGKLETDTQTGLWIINSSYTPPYENPLTITKIYIHDDSYMVSDLPLIESLNPYQFTKACCS